MALALAAIIFAILLVVWLGFSKKKETALPASAPAVYAIPKIDIDLDFLRKPLRVDSPYLAVELIASPASVTIGQKIDLTVNVFGLIGSTPFAYKFDCDDDGEYEKVAEGVYERTYTAAKICDYQKKGEYTAQVLVEGEFKYFTGESEGATQKESKKAFAKITIKDPNANPIISSCDVSPISGSTLIDSKFSFNVLANDPDNDKLLYFWDFGDGATQNISNPTHQYKVPGNYFPFVRVFDLTKEGEKKGGGASCYPSSLFILKDLRIFEEIPPFEKEFGRKNPFTPY